MREFLERLTVGRGALMAFLVAFAVFMPSMRYDFVYYDDPDYVMDNPHIKDGLTAEGIKWAFTCRSYADNWHPLTWVSLMGDVSVAKAVCGESPLKKEKVCESGLLPKLMHSHNVVLHALNAALLFVLLVMLSTQHSALSTQHSALPTALALALLWAVHPLRAEVVCWVTERKEALSVFFMLLALIFYVGGEGTRRPTNGFIARHFSLFTFHFSLLLFALALLAKPVAVTLPAVLLAWDWVILGRPRIVRIIPFAVMSLATCLMTLGAQDEAIAGASETFLSSRLETIFVGPLVYLRQTFWPFGLSAAYPATNKIDYLGVAAGIALVAGMVWVAVRWLRRREVWTGLATFGIAWVYAGLLPMLGVVKVGSQEHSDRYTYWIGCGVCAVIVLALDRMRPHWGRVYEWLRGKGLTETREQVRQMVVYGVLLVIAALAVATMAQEPRWRNPVVFYTETLQNSWDPQFAFALAVHVSKRDPRMAGEAERWLRKCATQNPCVAANTKLAKFLVMKGRETIPGFENENPYCEAEMLLHQALEAEPNYTEAVELLDKIEKAKAGK